MKICGIYRIVHTETGRCYVGQSVDVEGRWKGHLRGLCLGVHHSPRLQHAWNKHGQAAFAFEIIEHGEEGHLDSLEQKWIDQLDSAFNACKIAGSKRGWKASPETVEKIRKSNTGKKRTPEQIKAMSERLKGRKLSAEHIEKVASKNRGKKRTADCRKKMSEKAKGRVISESSRKKMSDAKRGRKQAPEQVAAAAATRVGKKRSQETRAKMSEARKRWWSEKKEGRK